MYLHCIQVPNTSFQIPSFSGPYFSILGLNMEIYEVNLHVQFENGKLRTRKNFILEHFSCGVYLAYISWQEIF